MRYQIKKLTRSHSTKAERKFMELCKKLHVPFRYKVMIEGYEVDFLIGRLALEINGHKQNVNKNIALIKAGYTPFNIDNATVTPNLSNWIKGL